MTIHLFAKEYPYITFENSSAGPEDKSFGNLVEIVEEPTGEAVRPIRMIILNCDNKRLGVDFFARTELTLAASPFWVVERGSVHFRKMNNDEKELFLKSVVTSLTQEQYALVMSKFDEMQ